MTAILGKTRGAFSGYAGDIAHWGTSPLLEGTFSEQPQSDQAIIALGFSSHDGWPLKLNHFEASSGHQRGREARYRSFEIPAWYHLSWILGTRG